MSRKLNDLDARFRPVAIELIARCVEAGIAVMITDTLRTPAEHAANLAKGTSKVNRSKHLDGLAIDLCPYEVYQLHGPDKLQWSAGPGWKGKTDAERFATPVDRTAVHEPWATIIEIAESLGLRSGGRWRSPFDPGHCEFKDG